MRLPQTFWQEKRLAVSCVLSVPSLLMIGAWIWMAADITVGYSEKLEPFFVTFFFLSTFCGIAGLFILRWRASPERLFLVLSSAFPPLFPMFSVLYMRCFRLLISQMLTPNHSPAPFAVDETNSAGRSMPQLGDGSGHGRYDSDI